MAVIALTQVVAVVDVAINRRNLAVSSEKY